MVDGVLISESRSIFVCALSGRPHLGSICRGTNKWSVLAGPGPKSSPSPFATIRNPRTSGFTTATVTTFCFSTAAESPSQPARTLPSVQRDRLSTESDYVAPICLGNHRRAHFFGFIQRHCNPYRGIASLPTRVAPRFERVKRSTRSTLSLCRTESTRRLFVCSLTSVIMSNFKNTMNV